MKKTMLGLATSLVDLTKDQDQEFKLRKTSSIGSRKLSYEQISDLFEVLVDILIFNHTLFSESR